MPSILVDVPNRATHGGAVPGSGIAAVCSWRHRRSFLRAMRYDVPSWCCVIHFALTRRGDERRF